MAQQGTGAARRRVAVLAIGVVAAVLAGCDAGAEAPEPPTAPTSAAPSSAAPSPAASSSAAPEPSASADPSPSATADPAAGKLPGADAAAKPGECGWSVTSTKGVDGTDKRYQLVVQTLRQPVDSSSIAVDTAVAAVGDAELPTSFVASSPTLVATHDGVVVARTEVGDGGLASPTKGLKERGLVTDVATSGLKAVTCGSDPAALPDGTYQVWAIETVAGAKGGKVTLLGGGQDVKIASGSPVSLCGADVGALPKGTDDATLAAHVTYETPDVDPATHPKKWLSAGLTFPRSDTEFSGVFATTVYLVDDTGHIVVDGTDPDHRLSGGAQPMILSEGGGGDGRAWDQPATACKDGKALPAGTYRAYVEMAVDRVGGKPGVLVLVGKSDDKAVIS